jgi:hypothetical protein
MLINSGIDYSVFFIGGSTIVSMVAVVHSVKVLSLSGVKLCLDLVINLLKCFTHLEKLHIKVTPCTMTKVCMDLHV